MKRALFLVICCLQIFHCTGWSQEKGNALYKDAKAPIPDRVRDLLGRMTVEEKVAQLESGWTLPAFGTFQIPSPIQGNQVNEAMAKKIAGNGLGTYAFLDEFLGTGGPHNPRLSAQHRNLLQSWVIKNTRLGIPIMFHGKPFMVR